MKAVELIFKKQFIVTNGAKEIGLIYLSNTFSESDNLTFDIVNILGKSIYSFTKKLSSSSNTFTKKIDVSQFDTGIYFLNVNSDFSYQSKKIILKD